MCHCRKPSHAKRLHKPRTSHGKTPCVPSHPRNLNEKTISHVMAPTHLQHRRTHNLLLVSKLLNQRDAASPFTLVLDSLEQSAKPLIAEYIRRAKVGGEERIHR